jgi:heterodisulfide reductase subunit B
MNINRYGLFLGCLISTEQYAYELSLRAVLPELDVELVNLDGLACCGAPLRSINLNLTLYLTARIIAICKRENVDLFTPCPSCHLALSETMHTLNTNPTLRERISKRLREEGLTYADELKIFHTIDLLYDEVGLQKIKARVTSPLNDILCATHYGCHLLRPHDLNRPDDPEKPEKLERLLEAIGARTKPYAEKLNCCGAPLMVNLPESGLTKAGQKLKAIQTHGFDILVTVCPWGHNMFDAKQSKAGDTIGTKLDLPVIYYTQLLGIALGIPPRKLGLDLNLSPIDKLRF